MANHSSENEYSEVMQYIRYLGNLRFAILTVFIAITGGLLTSIYTSELKPLIKFYLKRVGVFATLAFWVAELVAAIQCFKFIDRAEELEGILKYEIIPVLDTGATCQIRQIENGQAWGARSRNNQYRVRAGL